jgi:hypothetical protein
MRKITKAYGEYFEDEELDLSDATILICTFARCKIKFNEPAISYHTIFDHCTFNVPAEDVWKWLRLAIPFTELSGGE